MITQLINSKPGQTGGVANIPTQGNVPDGFKFTIVTDPTAPPGTDPLGYISIFGAGNSRRQGRVADRPGWQHYAAIAATTVRRPLLLRNPARRCEYASSARLRSR